MQGDIVKAAKWFGLSLVISALIFTVGLNAAARRLGRDLTIAGSNVRPSHTQFPNTITLRHSASAPFQFDLSPSGKELRLAPLKIDLKTD